jgi:hypothetical protein
MSPGEIARHVRKKLRQSADANRRAWPKIDLTCPGVYPTLPKPAEAPDALRMALRRDADDILAGRWRFFGHLELKVDDPPKWQCDYLAGKDLETLLSAFQLNYRTLTDGVDSKLIWEPSRWHQLVRLAMAAYVLGDRRAATKCMARRTSSTGTTTWTQRTYFPTNPQARNRSACATSSAVRWAVLS